MSVTGSRICVAVLAVALAVAGCDSDTGTAQPTPPASSGGTVTSAPVPTGPASPAPVTSSPSSPPATPPTAKPVTPSSADVIALVRTGGLAGQIQAVTVLPDGSWKRGNGRTFDHSGKLSAAQLGKLRTLAADPRLAAEAKRLPSAKSSCADVYSYILAIGGQTVRYTDCPSAPGRPVVAPQIVALLQDATK